MSAKERWGLGAVIAATLLALPAVAAQRSGERIHRERWEKASITRELGVNVTGGLNTYTGDLGNDTGVGAFLGVQADSRPMPVLGLELGYEGSRNPFSNIGGALWRHNVGALAKVGPELLANGSLRPFVGAGFGVSVLNPSGDSELLYSNDFITEVPLAAGVDYKLAGSVKAGARATYRILGGENLGAAQHGNDVNVGLQLGGSF